MKARVLLAQELAADAGNINYDDCDDGDTYWMNYD
jgi:hypothetical protein